MEKFIGVVDDYFAHVGVIALKLQDEVNMGDNIHIKGHTTDLTLIIDSMQIEHNSVTNAKAGDNVGIKISERAHRGDKIFKIIP